MALVTKGLSGCFARPITAYIPQAFRMKPTQPMHKAVLVSLININAPIGIDLTL